MQTVIITKFYKVSVRITDTQTLICEKYFFSIDQAVKFSEMIENGNENIMALVLTQICEDSIIYTKEDEK